MGLAGVSVGVLEFRVLGGLEARVDGTPVDLGGVRQRRLLAILLVDAGRAVSVDAIAERLWDDADRPAQAGRAIRTYVSRMRASFTQAGLDAEHVIVTEPPGYRLAVADAVLDSARVEALLVEARSLGVSSPGAALDALDEAVGLWRGEPYAEFGDRDWVQPEVQRLVELRSVVLEERAALRLAIGAHGEVIGDLERLVADYPLRAPPVELLMTALYRSGRQAEALRVGARHREELAELGLEVPESLAVLETRIATADETLTVTSSPAKTLRGYGLAEQIGHGAFSIVYRGSQPSLGREVAIKQIRAELADRTQFIRCFEAEAHLIACLEHPYIVPIHDYWREPGAAFLVMRWMRGGTLEAAIANRPLDPDQAAEMVVEVGSALAAAHQAGVVHRDVKSANVFLDGDGNYFLGDFGIAIDLADADPEALLSVGSPAYASPEQLRRETAGPASDIYGLGIVAYEALTGRLPYREDRSFAEITDLKSRQVLPAAHDLRSDLPAAVDAVLRRATAARADDRYDNVAEFVDAFVAALDTTSREPHWGTTTLVTDAPNPYKGLRAFDEADADDFYGRDRLVNRLIAQLEVDGPKGRLVAAVGPSGCGKSSVVRAGLLPRVRAGVIAGSQEWFVATMLPGPHPFEELEAALNHISITPTAGLVEVMSSDRRGIARAVKSALPDAGSELLLVIDQFEELYTQLDDARTRDRFLDGLVAAITEPRARLRVVATIRADFWDRPLQHPGLAQILETSAVTVTPLAADELEAAITQPASRVGVDLEPGLVSEIVADVHGQPGALPLLQYAMTELYDRRSAGVLARDAYRELDGVTGSLSRRAETLYLEASPHEQGAIRSVFSRLVRLGDGTPDTRRRVNVAAVSRTASAAEAIDRYGNARLLSFDRNPTTREPTVEISHEALIAEWPRLNAWLDEDRDGLRVLHHLTQAATNWQAGDRDPSDLYRGARLTAALDWSDTHSDELTATEQEFLDTSRQQHETDLRRQRRTNRRLRALLAGVAIALVLALVAASVAVVQRTRASNAADDAEAQRDVASRSAEEAGTARLVATSQLLAADNQQVALLLAVEAYHRAPTAASLGALQAALTARSGYLGQLPVEAGTDARFRVDFANDGSIVLAIADRGAQVFDPADHTLVRTIDYPGDGFMATSPDLPRVALTRGGEVAVFDLATGEQLVRIIPDSIAGPEQVWFAPDGELLVALSTGGLAIHAPDGSRIGTLDDDRVVQTLDFNGDGTVLVTATGNPQGFRVWDYPSRAEFPPAEVLLIDSTGGATESLDGVGGPISVGFSADDQYLAAGYGDGHVAIWETGAAPWSLHRSATTGEPINLDVGDQVGLGRQLWGVRVVDTDPIRVVAASDYMLYRWSLADNPLRPDRDISVPALSFDIQPSQDLDFDDHTATIITASNPSRIELWSADDRGLLEKPLGGPAVNYVSVSSEGDFIITQSGGPYALAGEIQRRDLATGETAPITDGATWGASLSPDDGHLVTAAPCTTGECGTLQLWDATSLEAIGASVEVPPGLQRRAFSPDGHYLAVGYGVTGPVSADFETNGFVEIYELTSTGLERTAQITDFREMSQGDPLEKIDDLAFSSDGHRLLVWDGTPTSSSAVAEWSVPDGKLLRDPTAIRAIVPGSPRGMTADGSSFVWRTTPSSLAFVDQHTLEEQGPRFLSVEGGAHSFARLTPNDEFMFTNANVSSGSTMWDVASRTQIGRPFPNTFLIHELLPESSPLGPALLTSTADQLLAWNIDVDSWPDIACIAAGRNLTRDEWDRYAPNEPYHTTCDQWPAPSDPDAASENP